MNLTALTPADAVPVRLAAERISRLDAERAWGRLQFARTSGQRLYHDVRHSAARRELVLNLAAARRVANA